MNAEEIEFGGVKIKIASLKDILKSKKAAGRPRDKAVLEILEKTQHEKEKQQGKRVSGTEKGK